jgi:hypothetical protein
VDLELVGAGGQRGAAGAGGLEAGEDDRAVGVGGEALEVVTTRPPVAMPAAEMMIAGLAALVERAWTLGVADVLGDRERGLAQLGAQAVVAGWAA